MVLMLIFLVKDKLPLLNFIFFLYFATEMMTAQNYSAKSKLGKTASSDAMNDLMKLGFDATNQNIMFLRNEFTQKFVQSSKAPAKPDKDPVTSGTVPPPLPNIDRLDSYDVITMDHVPDQSKHFIQYYDKNNPDLIIERLDFSKVQMKRAKYCKILHFNSGQ